MRNHGTNEFKIARILLMLHHWSGRMFFFS